MSLRKFAYRVAGPREFFIAGAINAGIAWLLFGGRSEVPLTGTHGVMAMGVPMSFLLPALSGFFGMLAAVRLRKLGQVEPSLPADTRWLTWSLRRATLWSFVCGIAALLLAWGLAKLPSQPTWDGSSVVAGLFLVSGIFAAIVHTRAVLATQRLPDRQA